MTLFYDPKSRKPKPWIFVIFIIIPIVLAIIGWIVGQGQVEDKSRQETITKDIFE